MKKKVFFIFVAFLILVVISFSLSSAITSDIEDSYKKKETMIVGFSGAINEPITNSQLLFKRNNVDVPLEYDIKNVGGKYYLWAIAPENENNYSLIINDISTTESGVNRKINYSREFIVTNESADYYIRPGFIISNEDFEVKINSDLNTKQDISVSFPSDRIVSIYPGVNSIYFKNELSGSNLIYIKVGIYTLPAYIIGTKIDSGETNGNSSKTNNVSRRLIINPEKIKSTVLFNEKKTYSFRVDPEYAASDVYLDYDRNIFSIEPDARFNFRENEPFYYNLTVKNYPDNESLSETIYLRSGNDSYPLYFEVIFTEKSEDVSTTYENSDGSVLTGARCSEIPGVVCSASEICSSTAVSSLDGPCCTTICQQKKSSGGSSVWGYVLFGILILILVAVWFWYKNKGGNRVSLANAVTTGPKNFD